MLAASEDRARALYDADVQSRPQERLDTERARAWGDLLQRVRSAPTLYAAAGAPREMSLVNGTALAAEIEAHPPFGRLQAVPEALIRAGLATASVPRPIPIAWTRADLDREASLGARAFWRAGLRPRGRTSDTLDGGLVTPGTLAISDALDALGALALPVGPITGEPALSRAREVWEIVQPQVLIADVRSFDFLEQNGACPAPRCVVLVTPADAERLRAPARSHVLRILSIPQACTFTAAECAAHDGYHVAEDDLAVEVADPRTGAASPDGDGTLVLTTLCRSLSLVRFDTGMRAALDRTPCTCGDTHARLRFA
jgi:phenylacetate-CoA ligase